MKNPSLELLNQKVLNLIEKYQNIKFNSLVIKSPYFINVAEQEYKKAMEVAGIDKDLIRKTIQIVKCGKTFLGSYGGKGSPEEIESDLKRLSKSFPKIGINQKKINVESIRQIMKEMHIGIDCSGFVYNVLKYAFEKTPLGKSFKLLNWTDPKMMVASRAGVSIFNSQNLIDIDKKKIKPLDLFILSTNSHIGIVVKKPRGLFLAESTLSCNGIILNKIIAKNGLLTVAGRPGWSIKKNQKTVIIKRFPELNNKNV